MTERVASSIERVCVCMGRRRGRDRVGDRETEWEGRETVSGCMESWGDTRQS